MTNPEKLQRLTVDCAKERLENLKALLAAEEHPPIKRPQFANNHIHTTYSFSPYSPTAAVFFAREAGLETAGIMDHDSIGGADEFRRAGEIAGIAVTCGLECRVTMQDTPLAGRRFNNPDQDGIAYMAIHSVMPDKVDFLQKTFAPLRARRNIRNQNMLQEINRRIVRLGITLDFDGDILPLSLYHQGGTVTERHLLWSLAGKILEVFGRNRVLGALETLDITPSPGQKAKLTAENQAIRYDLLGILKSYFVEQFYIPATEECLSLKELVSLSKQADAILCYPYLGDVGESVTGDKRSEQYEDSFLEELFTVLKAQGVAGITYMPSRNTAEQIARLRTLCTQHGFLEISGEDINSPSQSFICEKLAEPGFSHLVEATWMLINRERNGI